jgi:dephospho-CoA kinase
MSDRPFLLGLTGSIGMGKSTTAALFAEMGVPVWDADAAVHRLYARGGAAVPAIATLRPDAIHEGAVSREALKTWIADDPSALRRIEAVVHPLVAADRAAFIEAQGAAPLVVLDIPLLYEIGAEAALDAVLVVTAPPEVQRARVMQRPGMTEAQFDTILAKQVPDREKRARADHVIETRTLEQTRSEVQALVDKLKVAHA